MDAQDEIPLVMAKSVLASGSEAFKRGDYAVADSDLQEAVSLLQDLPMKLRHIYDGFDLRFQLAVCAFHLHDPAAAEAALLSVVDQQADMKAKALDICYAAHLLAQVYIKQGKLELARSTCDNSLRGRWKLLGKEHDAFYESAALLSRIYELLGNSRRAKSYLDIVPAERRKEFSSSMLLLGPAPLLPILVPKERPKLDWVGKVELKGHSDDVRSVAICPDGSLVASGSDDKTVRIWSTYSGMETKRLQFPGFVCSVAFSPDGKSLATAYYAGQLRIWCVSDWTKICEFEAANPANNVHTIALFSSDGKLFAYGSQIWDTISWKITHTIPATTLAGGFSPDCRTFAYWDASSRIINFWDIDRAFCHELQITAHDHKDLISFPRKLLFSPDGNLLISQSWTHVEVWNLQKPNSGNIGRSSFARLYCINETYSVIGLTPDGSLLATGEANTGKEFRIHDSTSGETVKTISLGFEYPTTSAFSPDGDVLVVGGRQGFLTLFDIMTL